VVEERPPRSRGTAVDQVRVRPAERRPCARDRGVEGRVGCRIGGEGDVGDLARGARRRHGARVPWGPMLAAVALAVPAPLAPRPAAPEDTYRLRTIAGIEISPDGKTLALTIERADEKEDSFRHEILLADADGRNPRPLCREDSECTDPRFSPDGTRLAWL